MTTVRVITNLVPCNGCTACCHGELIELRPQHGDDPARYQTDTIVKDGNEILVLKHKPGGDCIYLDGNHCAIWQDRPATCRIFDCRRIFLHSTRQQRRAAIATGKWRKEVIDAGRARLKVP